MADSLADHLKQDMQCEGVLACFHGLTALDRNCYRVLTEEGKSMTVDEIAAAVERERSTVYRAVNRLNEAGLIRQEQINYDDGGYYHVYTPRKPEEVTAEMRRLLNDWYAQMGELIQAFERKYSELIDSDLTDDSERLA